jgi:hypothetical protein
VSLEGLAKERICVGRVAKKTQPRCKWIGITVLSFPARIFGLFVQHATA